MDPTIERIEQRIGSKPIFLYMRVMPDFGGCDIVLEMLESGELAKLVTSTKG